MDSIERERDEVTTMSWCWATFSSQTKERRGYPRFQAASILYPAPIILLKVGYEKKKKIK
jgi:hypothetical protein